MYGTHLEFKEDVFVLSKVSRLPPIERSMDEVIYRNLCMCGRSSNPLLVLVELTLLKGQSTSESVGKSSVHLL